MGDHFRTDGLVAEQSFKEKLKSLSLDLAASLADGEQTGPSKQQIDRVRKAMLVVGKSAAPIRVLQALKEDNLEGKGMRNKTFDDCLRILADKGEYKGHKRSTKKRSV